MTTTIIISVVGISVFIMAIRAAIKYRNKGESKLSTYEHPSTFKKPHIELVVPVSESKDKRTATVKPKDKMVTKDGVSHSVYPILPRSSGTK